MYLHNIVAIVEEHEIPPDLIMNLDQTTVKYVHVSHHTMAKKGAKSVSIASSSDKRCITGAFVITLTGDFPPLQLIYGGKTTQSLHRFKFPESFSLSVTLRGLNFADFGKISKLSPSEKFATGHPRN